MTLAEKQVLITLSRLSDYDKGADAVTMDAFCRYFWDREKCDWTGAYESLAERGLIKIKESIPYITKPGSDIALKLTTIRNWDHFWKTGMDSPAIREYCKIVNGMDLIQDNNSDDAQRRALIEGLNLGPEMNVLDPGCGIGTLTEHISDLTGARITGVDFSPFAIDMARQRTDSKKDGLTFLVGDMDELELPDNTFDAIMDFDSIELAQGMTKALDQLRKTLKPGGRIALFYQVATASGAAKNALEPDNNRLSEYLHKSNLTYRTQDFTQNDIAFQHRAKEAAEKLEAAFLQEGNIRKSNNMLANCEHYIKLYESGRMRRYLYIIEG